MPDAKPQKTPVKPRPGRPSTVEVARRAVEAAGIDPALVDPRRILAGIAADPESPATARVAACKALLAASGALPADGGQAEDEPQDELTRRALAIMAGTGRPN